MTHEEKTSSDNPIEVIRNLITMAEMQRPKEDEIGLLAIQKAEKAIAQIETLYRVYEETREKKYGVPKILGNKFIQDFQFNCKARYSFNQIVWSSGGYLQEIRECVVFGKRLEFDEITEQYYWTYDLRYPTLNKPDSYHNVREYDIFPTNPNAQDGR